MGCLSQPYLLRANQKREKFSSDGHGDLDWSEQLTTPGDFWKGANGI